MSTEGAPGSDNIPGQNTDLSQSPGELAYAVLDVFAERALAGNPLAVFADGRGLSSAQMQAIAREMNLSETTFVLPRDTDTERREGVRVRIFTTTEELPFAGHPTLGTATWLYLHHATLRGEPIIELALNAGKVPVRFAARVEGAAGVFATMRQLDPVFGDAVSPELVAEAIGLRRENLPDDAAPQVVSTGTSFCVVPVRDVAALGAMQIDLRRARQCLDPLGVRFFYCIAPADGTGGSGFRARMQFNGGEDPATGSAAGCAIAWLVRHGRVESGRTVAIDQGIEIGRPSRLEVSASLHDGRVTDVFVAGRTIFVASGRLFLPRFTGYQQDKSRDLAI